MAWRVAFAGTPAFAVAVLRRLLDSPHEVASVFTQPDRPAKRGRRPQPSPVRTVAETAGLPVHVPTRFGATELAALADCDCLLVAAYGLLLPPAVLGAPRLGCINVHASLLPRWRGAAPVEHAILAGDAETGVSIMRMDAGLDTGPVYRRARLPLGPGATGEATTAALAALGGETLLEVLAALPGLEPSPQDDRAATHAPKLAPAASLIDWRQSAAQVDRQVRALVGRAPAVTTADGGHVRLRVLAARPAESSGADAPGVLRRAPAGWQVVCGDGALRLLTVQLNRGRGTPQPIDSAVNGYPKILFDGAVLGGERAPGNGRG